MYIDHDEWCECGHSIVAHAFAIKGKCFRIYRLSHDTSAHCACTGFRQMDWITDYCEVPDVLRS